MPAGLDFSRIFIEFVVLIFSLTVHEAAHAFTSDRLGDPTARLLGRVSLNPAVHVDPIGTILFPLIAMVTNVPVLGWAKPVPVNITRLKGHWKRKYMLIAAAGPASNVVLAILASVLLHVVPVAGGVEAATLAPLAAFLYQAVLLNVLLAVFNMVPVPPLDGGNVLAGVLRGPVADAYESLRPYGFMILYGLMFTGILTTIITPPARFLLSMLL
ncbi:MAG TPA: site-2 protease family protein [Vicinamibacterales bacterium]|nr:site-2 protease family protein [Vicinamibacterales bacterium]